MRWRGKKQRCLKTLPFEKTNVFEAKEFNSVVAWRKRLFSLSYQSALHNCCPRFYQGALEQNLLTHCLVYRKPSAKSFSWETSRKVRRWDAAQTVHVIMTKFWLSDDFVCELFFGLSIYQTCWQIVRFPTNESFSWEISKRKKAVHVNFDWLNTD